MPTFADVKSTPLWHAGYRVNCFQPLIRQFNFSDGEYAVLAAGNRTKRPRCDETGDIIHLA